MATAATDTMIVATAAEIVVTAEAIGVEAVIETTVAATTAAPVQVEVTMTDTDAAARATDTAEAEGTEAVTTIAVVVALAHALRVETGHVERENDPATAVVVRTVKEAAVRRTLLLKLQKTTVTSVLSSSNKSPSAPRPVISFPSSKL